MGGIIAVFSHLTHAGHGATISRALAATRGEGESTAAVFSTGDDGVGSNAQRRTEEAKASRREEETGSRFSVGVVAAVACLGFSAGMVEARARRKLAGETWVF